MGNEMNNETTTETKPNYRVHIFAVVRVPVDVHAENETEAIKLTQDTVHLDRIGVALNGRTGEYADEVSHYGVDRLEDGELPDETDIKWFHDDGVTPMPLTGSEPIQPTINAELIKACRTLILHHGESHTCDTCRMATELIERIETTAMP